MFKLRIMEVIFSKDSVVRIVNAAWAFVFMAKRPFVCIIIINII